MTYRMLVLSAFLFLLGCAPKADLDAANQKASDLQSQLAVAQAEIAKLQAQIVAAQSETEKTKAQAALEAQSLEAKAAQLQAKVNEKPEIPVSMSFRKALTGPGLVAVFTTTVKSAVPVLVTHKSSALGTTKQFELHLDPKLSKELGHLEGATISSGDSITIENQNFSPKTVVVQ